MAEPRCLPAHVEADIERMLAWANRFYDVEDAVMKLCERPHLALIQWALAFLGRCERTYTPWVEGIGYLSACDTFVPCRHLLHNKRGERILELDFAPVDVGVDVCVMA